MVTHRETWSISVLTSPIGNNNLRFRYGPSSSSGAHPQLYLFWYGTKTFLRGEACKTVNTCVATVRSLPATSQWRWCQRDDQQPSISFQTNAQWRRRQETLKKDRTRPSEHPGTPPHTHRLFHEFDVKNVPLRLL